MWQFTRPLSDLAQHASSQHNTGKFHLYRCESHFRDPSDHFKLVDKHFILSLAAKSIYLFSYTCWRSPDFYWRRRTEYTDVNNDQFYSRWRHSALRTRTGILCTRLVFRFLWLILQVYVMYFDSQQWLQKHQRFVFLKNYNNLILINLI